MKALISPNETVTQTTEWNLVEGVYQPTTVVLGPRIAEVAAASFEVAQPLFWVDCSNETETWWYYDSETSTCKRAPESVSEPLGGNSAVSNGIEQL